MRRSPRKHYLNVNISIALFSRRNARVCNRYSRTGWKKLFFFFIFVLDLFKPCTVESFIVTTDPCVHCVTQRVIFFFVLSEYVKKKIKLGMAFFVVKCSLKICFVCKVLHCACAVKTKFLLRPSLSMYTGCPKSTRQTQRLFLSHSQRKLNLLWPRRAVGSDSILSCPFRSSYKRGIIRQQLPCMVPTHMTCQRITSLKAFGWFRLAFGLRTTLWN